MIRSTVTVHGKKATLVTVKSKLQGDPVPALVNRHSIPTTCRASVVDQEPVVGLKLDNGFVTGVGNEEGVETSTIPFRRGKSLQLPPPSSRQPPPTVDSLKVWMRRSSLQPGAPP